MNKLIATLIVVLLVGFITVNHHLFRIGDKLSTLETTIDELPNKINTELKEITADISVE